MKLATKNEDVLARSYADRLILESLTEMESTMKLGELADRLNSTGLGLSAVRSLLASNADLFAYHERRWIPASRLANLGRPISAALKQTLQAFASPIGFDLLLKELRHVHQGDDSNLVPHIKRVIEHDPAFTMIGDKVALTELGFLADGEKTERAYAVNYVTAEEVAEAAKKLTKIDWRSEGAIAKAIAEAAPIRLRVLGAVAWSSMNSQDPRSILVYDSKAFLQEALSTPGYVLGPDGVLYAESEAKKWVIAATKLADKLAPTIEVEDAAPIEVKPTDLERIAKQIANSDKSITGRQILEESYEITLGNRTYPDDLANLAAALGTRSEIEWVGGDRFRKIGDKPDFIDTVPEPFQFTETENTDEEGELVDVELTDEGLSSSLRKLLSHPLAMDVLDEDIMPVPKTMPESVRLVLKSIHRELGTFPLCQLPSGWLDNDPKVQELMFVDHQGREQQVWVNLDTRLLYNLVDWWYEQPVESGAVFTLTKTANPNVLEFEWLEQPDPVVYISTQRMEELREIVANSEGKSTLDLLIEVMGHWPKGADFLTIHAEISVVRRSTRRLIASLLSSYQCFYQRSGSPVWHFDHKKVEQGFDKTKRKFVKK